MLHAVPPLVRRGKLPLLTKAAGTTHHLANLLPPNQATRVVEVVVLHRARRGNYNKMILLNMLVAKLNLHLILLQLNNVDLVTLLTKVERQKVVKANALTSRGRLVVVAGTPPRTNGVVTIHPRTRKGGTDGWCMSSFVKLSAR